MQITPTYTLSVEPFEGNAYQHPYHLGTIEPVARQVAADIFDGRRMRTVALIFNRKIVDVFDGEWQSATVARMMDDPSLGGRIKLDPAA